MDDELFKVGELARRAGVSVRTLHHYDAIGLLKPTLGGSGEARLYGKRELERLAAIRALQQLGVSLNEIRACLDDPDLVLPRLMEMHLERVTEERERAVRLHERLEAVVRSLRAADEPSLDTVLETLGAMNEMDERIKKAYSPEQLTYLAQRRRDVGEARMREVQGEWQELFAAYRASLERGDDPASEAVQELARRSHALIEEFTGGDAGVRESLGRMYQENPEMPREMGADPELWSFMAKAREAFEGGSSA